MSKSILDPDFQYTPAAKTDVMVTWRKHGFKSKKIDANTLLDNIEMSVLNVYAKDDPMRWPYHCGALSAHIRELVNIINMGL